MVKAKIENDIALITFDDGKANVLNESSLGHLKEALMESQQARALVLAGAGKCFSAGLDLKRLPTLDKDELVGLLEQFSEVLQLLLRFPCPVVAAVNGHAIAGGAVISLCCDVAIGAENELKIGLSEVAVGMPLPSLVVELARNRLSPKKLTEALLFGKLYDWKEAQEVGYLHQSVPAESLLDLSLSVAEQLKALPREAYSLTKKALWSKLPETLGAEAMGSFLTEQAQKHMAQFKTAKD